MSSGTDRAGGSLWASISPTTGRTRGRTTRPSTILRRRPGARHTFCPSSRAPLPRRSSAFQCRDALQGRAAGARPRCCRKIAGTRGHSVLLGQPGAAWRQGLRHLHPALCRPHGRYRHRRHGCHRRDPADLRQLRLRTGTRFSQIARICVMDCQPLQRLPNCCAASRAARKVSAQVAGIGRGSMILAAGL